MPDYTEKELRDMTPREMRDTIIDRLLWQKKYVGARYRGEEDRGCGCAVGVLILDEAYNPTAEGASVGGAKVGASGEWEADPALDIGPALEGGMGNSIALADMLQRSGVPATANHRLILCAAQTAHDAFMDSGPSYEEGSLIKAVVKSIRGRTEAFLLTMEKAE